MCKHVHMHVNAYSFENLSSVASCTGHLFWGFFTCGRTLKEDSIHELPEITWWIFFTVHFYGKKSMTFNNFSEDFVSLNWSRTTHWASISSRVQWEQNKRVLLTLQGHPENSFKESVKDCKSPLQQCLLFLTLLPLFFVNSLHEYFWWHRVTHKELKIFYLLFERHGIACPKSEHGNEDWGTTSRKQMTDVFCLVPSVLLKINWLSTFRNQDLSHLKKTPDF